MALLARASNIPARVVSGYRVTERNPIGNYAVVRKRDAHAWVEAYLPDRGWVTFDPTPTTALDSYRSPAILTGLIDYVSFSLTRIRQYSFLNRIPTSLIAVALILPAVAFFWLRSRRHAQIQPAANSSDAPPLPCFRDLIHALEKAGFIRNESESLEAFAARLRNSGAKDAAHIIESYAQFRYGAVGSHENIECQIAAFCKRS
jgi:hypothetical protein